MCFEMEPATMIAQARALHAGTAEPHPPKHHLNHHRTHPRAFRGRSAPWGTPDLAKPTDHPASHQPPPTHPPPRRIEPPDPPITWGRSWHPHTRRILYRFPFMHCYTPYMKVTTRKTKLDTSRLETAPISEHLCVNETSTIIGVQK